MQEDFDEEICMSPKLVVKHMMESEQSELIFSSRTQYTGERRYLVDWICGIVEYFDLATTTAHAAVSNILYACF